MKKLKTLPVLSIITAFLILIFITTACNEKHVQDKQMYSLQIKDSLNIPNAFDNNYFAYFTQVVHKNNKTYLIRDNYNAYAINIFDWQNKKKINKVDFKVEGPNGVEKLSASAIYAFDIDSLILITLTGKTYRTKEDSVLYQQNNLIDKEIFRSYGLNPFKPHQIDHYVYFWRASDYTLTENKYYSQSLYFRYNLKNNRIQKLNISFPPVINQQKWTEFQAGSYFTKNNQDLIIGFGATPLLYRYNAKQNKVTDTINIPKGLYQTDIKPVKVDENEAIRLKRTSFYSAIEYDQYRNIYYRFYFIPSQSDIKLTNKYDFWTSMPFVIQVLNKDFDIIAENRYPANYYNLRDYFITEEGLWISANNPENPNFNEDELHFKLFKLVSVNQKTP